MLIFIYVYVADGSLQLYKLLITIIYSAPQENDVQLSG